MHKRNKLVRAMACAVFLIVTVFAGDLFSKESEEEVLRLMSYNIHHGEGMDGKLDLKRIAEVIQEADLIALQEVDNNWEARSDFVHQAQWLAEALNRYYVYAANLDVDASSQREGIIENSRRQYGVALLSRYPIEFSRNYPLARIEYVAGMSEQRGLLETQVDISGRKLRVYVTHLSHSSKEQRLLQVEQVKKIVGGALTTGPPLGGMAMATSWVLMGDLNFTPDSEEYALLAGELGGDESLLKVGGFADAWRFVGQGEGSTMGLRTAHSRRIDYVFVSADLVPLLQAARVDTGTQASDHQPVMVEMRWSPVEE